MCISVNEDLAAYESLQSTSDIVRAVVSTVVCPVIGVATELSMKYWNKKEYKKKDVLKVMLSYVCITISSIIFAISLFGSEVWLTITFLGFSYGLVYTFESIGVIVNFPVRSQGIIFAIVELIGGLVNFVHIPIIEQVKSQGNFDIFNYFVLGLTLVLLLPGLILYLIGKWLIVYQ